MPIRWDAAERLNDGWYWQRSAKPGVSAFQGLDGVRGGPVKIDTGAWVGCNSIILGNVHIGQGCDYRGRFGCHS